MRTVPDATVGRLPLYLRALVAMAEAGVSGASSAALAEATGVNAAKVRKDLANLAITGTRGVGYDVAYLIHRIRGELGSTQRWPVMIVGLGNLGRALARFRGFGERGFEIAALVDADPAKIGEEVAGHRIRGMRELEAVVRDEGIAIGLICTPPSVAQEVADRLVASGVRSILNFAPAVITAPEGVSVRKVDLSLELQILAFYEQRKAAMATTVP